VRCHLTPRSTRTRRHVRGLACARRLPGTFGGTRDAPKARSVCFRPEAFVQIGARERETGYIVRRRAAKREWIFLSVTLTH